jgi:DNA-binding NtrC family response regulator
MGISSVVRRAAEAVGDPDAVAAAKRAMPEEALDAEGGHQTRVARRLGLTRLYIARLMKNLNLR